MQAGKGFLVFSAPYPLPIRVNEHGLNDVIATESVKRAGILPFVFASGAVKPDPSCEMELWHYSENGQQFGPISEADLGSLIAAGRVGPKTLVWREGMPHWLPLAQVSAQGGLEVLPPMMGYELLRPGTNSGFAIASMICGIISLMPCLGFVAIPAVICGHLAMHQIKNSRNRIVGQGMAVAGLICGYLSLLMMVGGISVRIFAMVIRP